MLRRMVRARGRAVRTRLNGLRGKAIVGALAASLVVLGGCGSSSSKPSSAARTGTFAPPLPVQPQGNPRAHGATIGVASGAHDKNGVILPRFTCKGANVSPQLSWKGLPGVLADTKEIVILAHTLTKKGIQINWAVANIKPSVNYIEATQLPHGAIVGRNSFGTLGYNMCPPKGALISIGIDALPREVPVKPGFDPKTLYPILESGEVQWGSVVMVGG
jgi:phosphatidylethanolamine-binding protein (PEBP) family uncharacterized protein